MNDNAITDADMERNRAMWRSIKANFRSPQRGIFEPPGSLAEFQQMGYQSRSIFQRDYPEAYRYFIEAERKESNKI